MQQCNANEARTFINATNAEVEQFHYGVGPCARDSPARTIATPQERATAAGLLLTDAQADRHGWTGSEEEEFVTLANGVIRGYWARNPNARVALFDVPAAGSRSSFEFPDQPALAALFNEAQSFAQKLQHLRDASRTAIAAVQGQKARLTGSQAIAKREKRRAGEKSRASGKYGTSAAGLARRSPHVKLEGKRSPPPAAASCLAEYIGGLLRKGKPPPPPPSAGAGSASKA